MKNNLNNSTDIQPENKKVDIMNKSLDMKELIERRKIVKQKFKMYLYF